MGFLSQRLMAVAEMVPPGSKVADIGCDHAYLSIYLARHGIADRVIACDINRGPVEIAKANIEDSGCSDKIEVRLCDGLSGIENGEADCVVIAGMGGKLMARIIEEGKVALGSVKQLILEPQSEVGSFRHFLEETGYMIVSEDMVYEDGKYYPIIKAVPGQMNLNEEVYYRYGKVLLREEHPVLHQFLLEERDFFGRLLEELSANKELPKVQNRIDEVRRDLAMCVKALTMVSEPGIFEGERVIDSR